ncbi:hypothetical protein [Paraburkholderia sp. DHOC27]|uniref:hypothetical protein n=1 Tax=Paraburkholderia sp. DHOC27 TaxID=2303330 RepID=UPI000E3C7A81|nr:hypothetical protein [Paraburkholderia sp. DHOC27]RFU46784.1 hypothetical protein D0B32_17460 [Paraburkholderia sp. DHOC27]
MSATEIIKRAASLCVRLWIDGERINMAGSPHSVAELKPELAAHKSRIMAHLRATTNDVTDCVGALIDADGGKYLPWGPYLSPAEVQRMRGELFDKIDELCRCECWSVERRCDTTTRIMRGPLADLLPKISHFSERLATLRAETAVRAAKQARTWSMDGFDDRRNK